MPPCRTREAKHLAAVAFAPQGPLLPGARRTIALALVLGPLLVGCANNPIARQLAASFDTPAPLPATPPAAGSPQTAAGAPAGATSPAARGPAGANPTAGNAGSTQSPTAAGESPAASPGTQPKPGQKGSSTPGAGASPGGNNPAKGNAPGPSQAPAQPKGAPRPAAAAAPYRVTIKLPGADPSAPAEVVTRALRAAGVSFEVETIERIGASTEASSSSRPAALRSTPAPAVR